MDYFRNPVAAKILAGNKKIIYFALLLVVVCFLTTARAQNSAPPTNQTAANAAPTATAAPIASPTAIPFSEIISQSENASATLKEIAAGASSDQTTDAVERDLPALTDEINARLEETAQTVEGSSSLDKLRSFEADWRALTKNLPVWRNDLTVRARKLEGDSRRTNELSEKWQQTLAELGTEETPPEVSSRVEEIIRVALETRRMITDQQARVARLQTKVAEQQTRVADALKTISARREALVGQLLAQDSPPVWSADFWTYGGAGSELRDSLRSQMDGLNAFAVRHREKLIVHILVFVLLAGTLFYLRRRARPLVAANPDLKRSAVIFYLPVPTAMVLAILFNSRIYPQTPQILAAIFGAAAIIPTVIILRRLVEKAFYPLLYALVAFFFVDQVRAISEGVPAIARPLFMAEMLAAVAFSLWFYRARINRKDGSDAERDDGESDEKSEGKEKKRARFFRVVRVAALVVLPIFAVAFLANAFGYANLSRLLGGAVLRSLYAAIVLYAIVRILDDLVIFALRFRPLNLLKMARDYAPEIREKWRKFIRFIALLLWLSVTLEQFTLRETVFREARAILTAKLTLGSLSVSLFDVLLFFFVVWAAFALSRFVRFALEEDVYPRLALARGIPYAVSTIINYVILLVGFFLAVGAAGFDLTRFTVLVGAFGVGIGFGLQNIFNNFVSGLILLFERPVRVGDEIKIGEASGTVKRIGIRASLIRQWDNSEIIVPNSKLISDTVKNWSYTTRKRGVEIPVSVQHGADADQVIELLKATALAHPLVANKPAPQVVFGEIALPALVFKLRVWTADADKTPQIATELSVAVSRALAENGIEVAPVAAAAENTVP